MPTALTELAVVNQALLLFGEQQVTSVTADTSTRGVLVAAHWPTVRDATLQAHPWNFAIRRAILYAYTEPAATLTPAALTGTGITFTASAASFAATDVGKTLERDNGPGKATITQFTDTTHVVATITENFSDTSALASGDWRLYNAAPAWGDYGRSFLLPSGILRVWRTKYSEPYQVEGQTIVADDDALPLLYIRQVTDPTEWTPLFVQAVTAHLAAVLVEPLTGQSSRVKQFFDLYSARLRQARLSDGQEGTPSVFVSDDLIAARLGRRGYWGGRPPWYPAL